VKPVKGVWLQHNPSENPLALLAVSRQFYHEARHVFYRYNTFAFQTTECLPVFFIGIGRENALLLQYVQWKRYTHRYENHIDIIKSSITATKPKTSTLKEVNIWNDEPQFLSFLLTIGFPNSVFRCNPNRLLRLDADCVSAKDGRYRYSFTTTMIHHDNNGGAQQNGKTTYELRTRRVKDDGPVQGTALHTLMAVVHG
jgi:hypothetical protein